MRTIPEIIKPSQPFGIEIAVSRIQDGLANISYIDDQSNNVPYFGDGLVFGVAEKDEKTNEPILYWRNKDYFRVFFDNYKASCFFYETDPRNITGRSSVFNLNLVVYYRQKLFKHNLNYSIQEGFINAIVQGVLQRDLTEEDFQSIQVFTQTDTVFTDFVLNKENTIFKNDDFKCFRISFTSQEQLSCDQQIIQ